MSAVQASKQTALWQILSRDGRLLFATRAARLFGYGFLSVILVLYLTALGISETKVGILLTLTLVGDTVISLWITTNADRIGRKRMLLAGAVLMILAGVLFALTRNYFLLVLAATIGVISPSGNEVGPFLSIEQASLAQLVPDQRRTGAFAWYNLFGSFATAIGALIGGGIAQALINGGLGPMVAYRYVVIGYAVVGVFLLILFLNLSLAVEVKPASVAFQHDETAARPFLGLTHSRPIVLRLAALFALDAFAGGFVLQSLVAYWFHVRFGVEPGVLGEIFFAANILAGVSALSAAWVARKIGLVRTMVFTHLPSNILLILVPFMPVLPLAILLLLLRFTISQMDVPTRQSYTMAVVAPEERSAAAGVTGVARTIGASLAPVFSGLFLGTPAFLGAPFVISGALKIVYDISLYRNFQGIKPPEES
ncbi:MAG: rane protein, major facilitator superfamily [Chloroflexi bacterium]|nr:rane protein, major facilitator superfamily [Chloroflexota bacterium]